MIVYISRRVFSLGFVVLGMSLLMFLIAHALPGDPARVAAGGREATADMIEHARKELGLDQPIVVQYGRYLRRLVQGDLGRSIVTQRRVWDDLAERFPATAELTLAAMFVTCVVGVPLGILAALRRGTVFDHLSRAITLIGVSMPVFWLGLVGILLFYVVLGWLPAGARMSYQLTPPVEVTGLYTIDSLLNGDVRRFGSATHHLILPAVILSSLSLAIVVRMTRACMLEVLHAEYVRTARAKGLSEMVVVLKHTLRNAAVPILTAVGLQTGALMGGAVLTETIFTWPGIGTYALAAVEHQDYPAIMGFAVVFSLLYAVINLVVDVVTMLLNPRL